MKRSAVTVVVPTKNAGSAFEHVLDALGSQQGLSRLHVIVVDSGSRDGTVARAEAAGAQLLQIPSALFSHSFARNLGERYAVGELVLFTVQDAVALDDRWLASVVDALHTADAAAATCAERPRRDADLFYRVVSRLHTRYMEIDGRDRVATRPAEATPDALRRSAGLNDVACLVRRDVFRRYKYRGEYAEDLDLGMRLVADGHRIAFLGTTPILHSHDRLAGYHLRRAYVDTLALLRILPGHPAVAVEAADVFGEALAIHAAIRKLLSGPLARLPLPCGVDDLGAEVVRALDGAAAPASAAELIPDRHVDPELAHLLDGLRRRGGTPRPRRAGGLVDATMGMVGAILDYLRDTEASIGRETVDDFGACLVKAFAHQTGARLAQAAAHGSSASRRELAAALGDLARGI